jgi:UDPglucose--hexose-1-phosphate uridylyltransferase
MSQVNIHKEIERLLNFAKNNGMLKELDVIPARNALLDLFGLSEPYDAEVLSESLESPVAILDPILDYAAAAGIIENSTTQRDLLDARIMGLLMPRQSEVAERFWKTAAETSIQKATDDFYHLSKNSNYIRMDRIAKNEYWQTSTSYGNIEITINLSKPEKDPKEIAAERKAPQSHYPGCLLCIENVGYAGRLNHPARQNLRVLPLALTGERWYFQYSPYVYYNEHSIIFCKEHTPMKISEKTFARLLDFVSEFAHYFVGSNADLPIVGGSILNHDHFQGGKHRFAMEMAPMEVRFTHPDYDGVKIGMVKWPMSVIRMSGKDKSSLIRLASRVLECWKSYSDPSVSIQAYSEDGDGETIPHNTITPIARQNAAGEFELDLVLRNNRTSEQHPEGIFHPHRELHHIKKENIGLIEVMGLAVLPGRLKIELQQIQNILTGESSGLEDLKQNQDHALNKHAEWIDRLLQEHGKGLAKEQAEDLLRQEVGNKFLSVLLDAGVYKKDSEGYEAFKAFMSHAGFVVSRD